ncbi:putative WRKY transcription factor 69 [Zea mays]|uniref:Putative WRKY transcription factor 69 n=1 Tax=Zea mays TaxID=4577 RepID=A0A1D6NCG7_MAIZE|nr:putative WRKY transcription factor 69 [Zea mays]
MANSALVYFCASSRRSVEKRVVSVPLAECGEGPPPSDSWAWRKYGQKPIKGSPYPRYVRTPPMQLLLLLNLLISILSDDKPASRFCVSCAGVTTAAAAPRGAQRGSRWSAATRTPPRCSSPTPSSTITRRRSPRPAAAAAATSKASRPRGRRRRSLSRPWSWSSGMSSARSTSQKRSTSRRKRASHVWPVRKRQQP